MKPTASRRRAVILPLTIGTPYGAVRLELQECFDCGGHFNFRIVEVAPALRTRAAEPFLYRLMHTLEAVGAELWMDLPPASVRRAIEAGTYSNDALTIPKTDA